MKTTKLFLIKILFLLFINSLKAQVLLTNPGATYYGPSPAFGGGAAGSSGSVNTFLGYACANMLTGDFNVALGGYNYYNITGTGSRNVLLGYQCGQFSTGLGSNNTYVGERSGSSSSGSSNSYFGSLAGTGSGSFNNAFGNGSSASTSGIYNSVFGSESSSGTSGNYNTIVGSRSGTGIGAGSNNTFLGARISVPGSVSNTIIIADGDGNQRIYGNATGNIGIGNTNPQNKVEITSNVFNSATLSSGLRLTNLKYNMITPIANPSPSRGVLTTDINGDVIMVTDQTGGGITNSCTTNYLVPTNNGTGNLGCGQIYDNASSVSIGTALTSSAALTYNSAGYATLGVGTVPATGNLKLDVNGITRSVAYFATSDKKFKKEIKAINSPLEAIQKLEGKTYLWNREANKEMNFDAGLHSGFIAQELEKVLPHLVATDEKGNKAVNYTELIPYLVEAIKEQQTQINDLKNQISENFKTQNQDLLELKNTKIISVSPNPSNDVISVSFNVDKSVQSAKLLVHDLNGNVLSSLNINDRDNNLTRTLQKDNFGKGIYIVSLVINGKSIDTKKIIFN